MWFSNVQIMKAIILELFFVLFSDGCAVNVIRSVGQN